MKWSHHWKWKSYRTSYLIKCTFDMMPSPANLFKWRISRDDRCACGGKGTLFHILVNCPLGLPKRYTWRHNQVLKVVSDAVRVKLDEINDTLIIGINDGGLGVEGLESGDGGLSGGLNLGGDAEESNKSEILH